MNTEQFQRALAIFENSVVVLQGARDANTVSGTPEENNLLPLMEFQVRKNRDFIVSLFTDALNKR